MILHIDRDNRREVLAQLEVVIDALEHILGVLHSPITLENREDMYSRVNDLKARLIIVYEKIAGNNPWDYKSESNGIDDNQFYELGDT